MNIWKRAILRSACAIVPVFTALTARADVISQVTSGAGMSANDSVSWTQLGPDGSSIGQTFTATSAGGLAVGGSFASGGGQVCDTGYDTCAQALSTYSIESNNGSGGTGPITLTFSGVYGVGTNIINNAAANNALQFAASLALYNGSTLLGTVTGASDSNGDPFYLGALDQTGANVTSAVFSVTSIGTAPTTATYSYNYSLGYIDPAECSFFTEADFANVVDRLACPQHTLSTPYTFPFTGPYPPPYENPDVTVTPIGGFDTDSSDLADLFIGAVDLNVPTTTAQTDTPEPATFLLFGTGILMLRGLRRRGSRPAAMQP